MLGTTAEEKMRDENGLKKERATGQEGEVVGGGGGEAGKRWRNGGRCVGG